MKKNIVIHIPHASLELPDIFYKNLLVDKDQIQKENIFISDYLVDKLIPDNLEYILKFNYSRLFCDIERFPDDNLESMSKKGMGVIYTKDSSGTNFINITDNYKREVMNKYYFPFHQLIDETVMKVINQYDHCYFIDFHSFSDQFVDKVFHKKNNPDICIGFEEEYINPFLLKFTVNFFQSYGYSVKINYPYTGVLIPNIILKNHIHKIDAIMIEINKRIYLDNNEFINEEKFTYLKNCLKEYFDKIK